MQTSHVQSVLDTLVPGMGRVKEVHPVGGGCISEAVHVVIDPPDRTLSELFVKRNDESFEENFRCEWDGLVRLSEPDAIGVPEPVTVGKVAGSAWLVTRWVQQGGRGPDFFDRFGRDLAGLHRSTLGTRIGLENDNFLGSARQPNGGCDDWVAFVADHRIGFQIRWARDQGLASDDLVRDSQQIIDRMGELLSGRSSSTSLLHGDLWSGNYLCGQQGRPYIIDPAIYYGCREAEFGMLRLFGSCPRAFYDAYHSTFPLPDGWQRRSNVYVLYHLLNHLNLFGRGYLDQCRSTAADILRS